jgi:hypothetical protein
MVVSISKRTETYRGNSTQNLLRAKIYFTFSRAICKIALHIWSEYKKSPRNHPVAKEMNKETFISYNRINLYGFAKSPISYLFVLLKQKSYFFK